MRFVFTVEVEVERSEGKFVSRSDISDQLLEAIDEGVNNADLSGMGSDGDSEYEITDTSINEEDHKR